MMCRPAGIVSCALAFAFVWAVNTCLADDWPMRGRTNDRNPVSPEKNSPAHWSVGSDREPTNGLQWSARLGSLTEGTPVVANGLVWVGTNAGFERPDATVLMCFRETDGKFLYEYASQRLPDGREYDWPQSALASSPLIENGRLWFCNNRCEVICLDIQPLITAIGQPRMVWKFDMRRELGIVPRTPMIGNSSSHCSVAAFGDWIYVNTNNSRHAGSVPAPTAPSLVCFDKSTGAIVWSDNSPGENIMYTQQGNPTVFVIDEQSQVVIGQGDGWMRSFDCATGKLLWAFNMNPADTKADDYYRGRRSYVPTAPVFYADRIYAIAGSDPESGGLGAGRVVCLDPRKRGDVSSDRLNDAGAAIPNPNSALLWEQVGRTRERQDKIDAAVIHQAIGGLAIHNGMMIAADMAGIIHCWDADSGSQLWFHETDSVVWADPLVVDDRIFIGTEDGRMLVLALSREKQILALNEHDDSISTGAVFANGTLYVATRKWLHAVRSPGSR